MHSKSGLAKRDSKAIKAKLEQIAQQHGIKPKLTTCPKGEQAATQQDWDPNL